MGARLSIHGKKGSDFARIISSAPSLKLWLDFHPSRENPDSPVWIGIGNRRANEQISYSAAASALKKIAKRAGIKKRIFYYLLRHTRIDETQGILTESQQCMMFGWQFGSRMPAVYMKRYGKHIDNAQAVMNGVANTQTKQVELQKPVTCGRCSFENSPYSDSCQRCSMSLKVKFGVQLEESKKNAEDLLYDILNDSEKLEKLRQFLAESHSK
jgi:DNA-directed RNA polymerase subunit M/transcription elongation factor TFIIS